MDLSAAPDVSLKALIEVLNGADALTEVALCADTPAGNRLHGVASLLAAAPVLRLLRVPKLVCKGDPPMFMPALLSALHNEAPFSALRVRALCVTGDADADALRALARAVGAHASLTSLLLSDAPQLGGVPSALDAVVDAALARPLTSLDFR